MFLRKAESKIKIAATINHCGEHLIDGVAVNARAFRDLATKFAAVATQEAARCGRGFMAGGGGEKKEQGAGRKRGAPGSIKSPRLFFGRSPGDACVRPPLRLGPAGCCGDFSRRVP